MAKEKLKLLIVKQILETETDAEHPITLPQLIARLEEHGIHAERKSLYDDFRALEDFGERENF